jgi:hypothetical protein
MREDLPNEGEDVSRRSNMNIRVNKLLLIPCFLLRMMKARHEDGVDKPETRSP